MGDDVAKGRCVRLARVARYVGVDSLVEGEAKFQEWRYDAALAGIDSAEIDWTKTFQSSVERDEREILAESSRYTASYRMFPYGFGSRYVHWLYEGGGSSALHDAYAMPALTTRTLMASELAVEVDLEAVTLSEPIAPPEWTPYYTPTSLGAWGVFLLALPSLGVDSARSLALSWRGDRLTVYENLAPERGETTGLVWRCELADEAAASSLLSNLPAGLDSGVVARQEGRDVVVALNSPTDALEWAFSE